MVTYEELTKQELDLYGYQTLCANCQSKKEILRRRILSEDISRFNKR